MNMDKSQSAQRPPTETAALQLLHLVDRLAEETGRRRHAQVTLDCSLERELGLDSLARVELLLRVSREFNVSLPPSALATAETPHDLLRLINAARPGHSSAPESDIRNLSVGGALEVPASASTLNEVLDWHAARHPQRLHASIYDDDDVEHTLNYAQLADGAGAVATRLIAHGLDPGETVAIMLPSGADYFFTFMGILLAGGVPVPIYPPVRLSQIEDHMRRHVGILSNARIAMLVTVPAARSVAWLLRPHVETLRDIINVEELVAPGPVTTRIPAHSDDLAFLQYTSGSTGNPKGVMLTHANLLANIRAMGEAIGVTSSDVFVSWLPLYHDMGLIGAWLGSLYFGMPLVIMSPLAFLVRPQRWLWAIHRHRGTLSAAPNFAYELCMRKIEDSEIQGLDLSSWRRAFNGAEPVQPETITGFQKRFAGFGFRADAMAPVYGLAESSVGLALQPPGRSAVIDRVDRDSFVRSGHALPAPREAASALQFAGCGMPLPGHQVRVVGATGVELGERHEGRLEFKGPSSTRGYYRNPEATRKLFDGDWLDTGDKAYLAGGEIFLTGRVKDIIIRGGRNIYPYEIEQAVGDVPGVRRGCVAVFASPDPQSGTERLIVLAETREIGAAARAALRRTIGDRVLDAIGMPADDIMLAPPHTVLKTSSGKIRRAASREFYERGGAAGRPAPVWLQLMRLTLAGVVPSLVRLAHAAAAIAYASYVWIVFLMLAPLAWLVVSALRMPRHARAFAHDAARLLLWLARIQLKTDGLANLSATRCLLAANHASYVDGILLVAALPRHFPHAFVAKSELRTSLVPRLFLQGMGACFVARFDAQQGTEDVDTLVRIIDEKRAPVIFPEGTFDRRPGLLAFRSGAFAIAARATVPVIPVTIRGARSILRDGSWFPYRHAVHITFGAPISPSGTQWSDVVLLRDEVRKVILGHCGEPDLGR